jgi:hypothetical protein
MNAERLACSHFIQRRLYLTCDLSTAGETSLLMAMRSSLSTFSILASTAASGYRSFAEWMRSLSLP